MYYIFSLTSSILSYKENMQPIPNQQEIDISTIDNFRTFLEQLHMFASKDEISDASYNFCTKVKNLATLIDPIMGSIKTQSISTIFKSYGAAANPTPGPLAPPTAPPLPIVNNMYDYIQLLSLSVRGSMILSLSRPDVNINNKLDLIKQDTLENAYNIGLVDCANRQFIPIRDILQYFHNQKVDNTPTPGDTYDTALVYDSCEKINAAAPKFMSKAYSIFKQPNQINTQTVPKWANRMRVLVIGAGGGGGGGGNGFHSGGHQNDDGGGGGASGNSGIAVCSHTISVSPGAQYTVAIGQGGAGGQKGVGGEEDEPKHGSQGSTTTFTYGSGNITVKGGNYGKRGYNGRIGHDYGRGGKSNVEDIGNKYSNVDIAVDMVSDTVFGNVGIDSTAHDALDQTTGGKGGNSVTLNSVDDVIKSMLQDTSLTESEINELQKNSGLNNVHLNCGFGGKGGDGYSGEQVNSDGSSGGSGYVLVVYYE
jgi:hypothetical protein